MSQVIQWQSRGQGQAGKMAATEAGLGGSKQSKSAAMVAETGQGTEDLINDKKSDEAHKMCLKN